MRNCDTCDDRCHCHLNPPCSFCVEHSECETCGQLTCKPVEAVRHSDGQCIVICRGCSDVHGFLFCTKCCREVDQAQVSAEEKHTFCAADVEWRFDDDD